MEGNLFQAGFYLAIKDSLSSFPSPDAHHRSFLGSFSASTRVPSTQSSVAHAVNICLSVPYTRMSSAVSPFWFYLSVSYKLKRSRKWQTLCVLVSCFVLLKPNKGPVYCGLALLNIPGCAVWRSAKLLDARAAGECGGTNAYAAGKRKKHTRQLAATMHAD